MSSSDNNSLVLFPGEKFPFNRKLLNYNMFTYSKNNYTNKESLISLRTSVLQLDNNKKLIPDSPQIYYGNYYTPMVGDTVIGVITQKTYEFYRLNINSSKEAILNSLDFEGASKKSKPNLNVGDVVFAVVEKYNKFSNASLTCKTKDNSKGWASGESKFGELKEGFLFKIKRFDAWKIMEKQDLISRMNDCANFKLKVGLNGNLWIKADYIYDTQNIFKTLMQGIKLKSHNEIEALLKKNLMK